MVYVSEPVDGKTHDAKAIDESGLLEFIGAGNLVGDRGYQGRGMITPVKKTAGGELAESDKEYNTAINSIRYVVERCIANLKTWRILFTDFRRPFEKFRESIDAVLALEFYRQTL